jgi:hypothetical protein
MDTLVLLVLAGGPAAAPPVSAEDRALAYLVGEVPRWSKEHRCFSCHHNGDAARALFRAVRVGKAIPDKALADTKLWLTRPAGWDRNGGEQFSDKKLARIQFAAALVAGTDAALIRDKAALDEAARLVAAMQAPNGSWKVLASDALGSATTLGTPLATHLARGVLRHADDRRYQGAIAKADGWLRAAPIDSVLDAASVLLALEKAEDAAARVQKRRCLELLRRGRSRQGGWGPFVGSAPEVFDTALVLLALSGQPRTAEIDGWLRSGRAYLRSTQEPDGSWPETTRPSGAESYAQRLSTAGWATLALLETR